MMTPTCGPSVSLQEAWQADTLIFQVRDESNAMINIDGTFRRAIAFFAFLVFSVFSLNHQLLLALEGAVRCPRDGVGSEAKNFPAAGLHTDLPIQGRPGR